MKIECNRKRDGCNRSNMHSKDDIAFYWSIAGMKSICFKSLTLHHFFSFALQCPVSIYSSSCPFVLASTPRWPYSDKSALLNFAVFRTVAIHQYCSWCLHTAHIHCEKRAMFVGLWVDASFSLIANAEEEKKPKFVVCVCALCLSFALYIYMLNKWTWLFLPKFCNTHVCRLECASASKWSLFRVWFILNMPFVCLNKVFLFLFLVQQKWKNVEGQSARFVYTNIQTETTNRKMAQHLWIATKF